MQNAFSFDFNQVDISDNPIDEFPFDVPLSAEIKKVEYRDLARKDSGETKIRLIIGQDVHFNDQIGYYETVISPNQAYILKQYLSAVGVDTAELSGQEMTSEMLASALVGSVVSLTTTEREWNGKTYRNFKRVKTYQVNDDDLTVSDNLPF